MKTIRSLYSAITEHFNENKEIDDQEGVLVSESQLEDEETELDEEDDDPNDSASKKKVEEGELEDETKL